MIHLSKTSKMDGIKSWSLQAMETCPGSFNSDGTLVPPCEMCYASVGRYHGNNVKIPRINNRAAWQDESWVIDMINMIKEEKFFRWFDSGDVYHPKLAEKIYQVMKGTPNVRHWLPTRSHKIDKIRPWLEKMNKLENVKVRYSSDSVMGEYEKGLHGSTIIPAHHTDDENLTVCGAYSRGGKCKGCRACWDKNVDIIAYPAHGIRAKKVIRLLLVA